MKLLDFEIKTFEIERNVFFLGILFSGIIFNGCDRSLDLFLLGYIKFGLMSICSAINTV